MHEIVLSGRHLSLVRDLGKTLTGPGWVHPDRVIDFHVMIFTLTGCMQVVEEGMEYLLHPGDVFFLKAGVQHWGQAKTQPGTSNYHVHFFDPVILGSEEAEEYRFFPDRPSFSRPDHDYRMTLPKQLRVKDTQGFRLKLESLYRLYEQAEFANPMTLNLGLMEILTDVYRQSRLEYQPHHHPSVGLVLDYLEQNLDKPLDTTALGSHLKLNYNYLSGLFSRQMGLSIKEYLMRLRVHRAAHLLKATVGNVAEVGRAVGFEDPLYFSRAFRKVMGESPSVYLKSVYR